MLTGYIYRIFLRHVIVNKINVDIFVTIFTSHFDKIKKFDILGLVLTFIFIAL